MSQLSGLERDLIKGLQLASAHLSKHLSSGYLPDQVIGGLIDRILDDL
jgi:hypothetical protein